MTESVSNRTQMLNRLARLIAAKTPPHPLRVAIDGRTAAGKTTLANELVTPLERLGRNVIRVEIDDFHQPLQAVRNQSPNAATGPLWRRSSANRTHGSSHVQRS